MWRYIFGYNQTHPIMILIKNWQFELGGSYETNLRHNGKILITAISGNFFAIIKELKSGIWMNINFATYWFVHATIYFSNLYCIFSFHLFSQIIPQWSQILTASKCCYHSPQVSKQLKFSQDDCRVEERKLPMLAPGNAEFHKPRSVRLLDLNETDKHETKVTERCDRNTNKWRAIQ